MAVGMGIAPRGNGHTAPKARAMAGLVLFNPSVKPVYANSEALRIISYPNRPAKRYLTNGFVEKLRPIISQRFAARTSILFAEVVSGRRHYRCKLLLLEHDARNESEPSIAAVIERENGTRDEIIDRLCEKYQLTARERQAVELLAEGLTGKEIASRMSISPNTVKTFLRLVMIKIGAPNRSGVIGRLIDTALGGETVARVDLAAGV